MKSDGSAVRSFCYLPDAVAAIFTVLFKGKDAEAYNTGNDQGELSVLGLAKMLVAAFPERKLRVITQPPANPASGYLKSVIPRFHPDINKIKSLGWAPRFPIKEGFIRTVRSFEK